MLLPAHGRRKPEDHHKFKGSLVYTVTVSRESVIIAQEVVERMLEPQAVGYHKETVLLDAQELNSVTVWTRQCKPKPEQVPAWSGVRHEVPPQARSYREFLAAGSGGRDTDRPFSPTNMDPHKSNSHTPIEGCIIKNFWTY